MGKTIEEKRTELQRLQEENKRAEEEEEIDKELAKERKKKKDRSLFSKILRELK